MSASLALAPADAPLWPCGIDPGESGACVVLRPGRRPDKTHDAALVVAWTARARGRGYWIDWADGTERTIEPSLGQVGDLLQHEVAELGPLLLVTEGQFIPPSGGAGIQSVLTLARAAGKVQGPLEHLAAVVEQPTSRKWRPRFRISPQASASACSAHALRIAPRLVNGLGSLATNEHVAEAALLAVYGWQVRSQATTAKEVT